MLEDQLERQLAALFSDVVMPEPEPQPTPDEPRLRRPVTEPPKAGTVVATPALNPKVAPALPRQPLARAEVVPVFPSQGDSTPTPGRAGFLARLARALKELALAIGYLLALGLAETVAVRVDPRIGFVLYSLILLLLFLYAAFAREARAGHLCLALTVIPLIRILGLSTPLSEFPLREQRLVVMACLSFFAVGLVVYYLDSDSWQTDPGHGTRSPGQQLFLLVLLIGMPLGLVAYHILEFPLLVNAPISVETLAICLLIALLALGELVSTLEARWQTFGRFLNIAIGPLFVTFSIHVVIRIANILT